MQQHEEDFICMLAAEAYLRRAAEHDLPFMLKGSLVTRQYLPDPDIRIAQDLDWVYLLPIADPVNERETFSSWARLVTETELYDGAQFRSFKENDFWRSIDYAMDDDFPTINTDLLTWVDGIECDWLAMDISFNPPIQTKPIPLMYKPLRGEPFLIKNTCPLSLQIAWKLHQTMVSPRYKDIFDLIYLLKHPDFNEETRAACLQELANECYRDGMNLNEKLLDINLLPNLTEKYYALRESYAHHYITILPPSLKDLCDQFTEAMRDAELEDAMNGNLPKPTISKKK